MDPKEELKKVRRQIKALAFKADLSDEEMKQLQTLQSQAAKLEAQVEAQAQAAKLAEEEKTEAEAATAEAIKAAKAEWEKEAAKNRRPPFDGGQAPYQAKFGGLWKYDHLGVADITLGAAILKAGHATKSDKIPAPSKEMLQAAALRAFENKDDKEREVNNFVSQALKAAGMQAAKSDEVMQQDLASYGDEWVGVGYGTTLWEKIRTDPNPIINNIPTQEIPQGMETFYDPTEGADPVFYKVPETTDENATTKIPNATVTSSRIGTGRANETLAKMGARVQWSGELNEDTLIPMLPEIRRKLVVRGQETLAHILIDGDTATGATTNINDIAGTPAGTEAFLIADGFRKLALVTNTANSRSGGALAVEDFKDTAVLMGLGGKDALDRSKVAFIIDLWTHWKALELAEVKTKDVFSQPTIEGGKLIGLWGYPVIATEFMHHANQDATYGLKANTAGKVDLDTASNNTTGSILAVRWDRWKLGWKRRMTIETERIARSDSYEIVALMRLGLKYFSNEASAITYNLTV